MSPGSLHIAVVGLVLVGLMNARIEAAEPASAPIAALGAWDAHWFDYRRPEKLVVEETTPTRDQTAFLGRPAQMPADIKAPVAASQPAKPVRIGPMNVIHLRFRDVEGADVPVLLCTPADKKGPFPLIISVHGMASNKAVACLGVARSAADSGFAILAPDMPLHGERPGDSLKFTDPTNPLAAAKHYRQAVVDVRQCIDLAEQRADLDVRKGVILVGYSMGSFIDTGVGSVDPRAKAMVLMVGGDMPALGGAVADARRPPSFMQDAIAHFAGRPLLMLNGKTDTLVKPDQAERLFAAAKEPKQQTWYDSGHFLPAKAFEDAGKWIDETWKEIAKP